ncbi:Lanthionine synthetase C-like protein [Streptomyces sp. 2131.1]|uniref:lanthionine synthetase C family protein n=1 Tax=Streptomyces sp. 2131.1 TaxID=1855346 RepID=UPI00089CBDC4|nr:lanthionine synthetase C family protein [Streptomyces sp. 2131.1]SEC21090.1 Lanthionine synthetase C-like protein [Streptomyces sp. 2131.1]
MSTGIRNRAKQVADEIATRLTDPDLLVAAQKGPDLDHFPREELSTLARGYSGISLLFTTRAGAGKTSDASIAHQYLQRCAQLQEDSSHTGLVGLHNNITGLGFAMASARLVTGGYTKALGQLDRRVTASARAICEFANLEIYESLNQYDVISGLSGIGRYLLMRGQEAEDAIQLVLETLTQRALSEVTDQRNLSSGRRLPGFWSSGAPSATYDESSEEAQYGHLNLGVAHGIPGPLALLSLAKLQGYTCEGQSDAISVLADLLMEWCQEDARGLYWPAFISRSEWDRGVPRPGKSMARWCYGTPGVARVLQLAGQAEERDDWLSAAERGISALLEAPLSAWQVIDMGLCHGWAGVLQLLGYFASGDSSRHHVDEVRDTIAEMIVESFAPDTRYGYQVGMLAGQSGGDYPGLLEGAAGIALALDSYAECSTTSKNTWDAAFLMS